MALNKNERRKETKEAAAVAAPRCSDPYALAIILVRSAPICRPPTANKDLRGEARLAMSKSGRGFFEPEGVSLTPSSVGSQS